MKLLFTLLILSLLLACRKDVCTEAEILYQKGLQLEAQNHPDSAVNVYRKAIDLLNNSEEYELMSKIYNQFGDLLVINGVYSRALEAHKKALEYGNLIEDKTQSSRAYRGIGKNYYLQKRVKEALLYFTKALELKNKIENKEERSSIYNNLSNVYYTLKDYEKALEYNNKAISFTNDSLKIYRNYSVKGKLFTLLQQYDSAYHYLLAGSQSSNIRTQVSSLFKLSEMPPESGITDSMKYNYLNNARVLQDSIEYMDKAVQIAEVDYQHQLTEIKKEDKHRLMFVILFSSIFILTISFYIYYRYKKRIKIYQEKINQLYNEFSQKEEKLSDDYDREKQIINIISRTGDACCEKFASSAYCKELKVKLATGNDCLTYTEQDKLQEMIFKNFDVYIQQIASIINLSANDTMLCCLSLLKFTTKECAACRGVSSETIRSQRTRIKKRIPKIFFNNGLFNVLFGEE